MFPEITSVASRFRQFRERVGLSHDQVAAQVGLEIGASCIWDIEADDNELASCYSSTEVQLFCHLLRITPAELFGIQISEPPIFAEELAPLIHRECQERNITLQQFEDSVGWHLAGSMTPSERLLAHMSVDGLQWLCRELHIDWRRIILSL
jgi:hypothetical protein